MLLYLVYAHHDDAKPGDPGSPTCTAPGAADGSTTRANYDTWYFAATLEAGVGEVFGDLAQWSEDMFDFPAQPVAA